MKAYEVYGDMDRFSEGQGYFAVVVADSKEEVKMIVDNDGDYFGDLEDLEIKVNGYIDVSGMEKGIISGIDGLKLGWFSLIKDNCPVCNRFRKLYLQEDGSVLCAECVDAQYDNWE